VSHDSEIIPSMDHQGSPSPPGHVLSWHFNTFCYNSTFVYTFGFLRSEACTTSPDENLISDLDCRAAYIVDIRTVSCRFQGSSLSGFNDFEDQRNVLTDVTLRYTY